MLVRHKALLTVSLTAAVASLFLLGGTDAEWTPSSSTEPSGDRTEGERSTKDAVELGTDDASNVVRQSVAATAQKRPPEQEVVTDSAATIDPLGLQLPRWFAEHELLKGVTLQDFDPAGYEIDDLYRAGQSMLMLEVEYRRRLREQDPSIKYRLVSLEEATLANEGGAVVLEYGVGSGSKYLICTAVEAAPILKLREVHAEMVWSDTWVGATKKRIQEQHGGSVVLDPSGDGSTYDILVNGEVVGFGELHVPGML